MELLVKTTLGFDEQIIQPLAAQETPAGTARLPAVDREILNSLLARREPGINVLLHGKASVDKLRLARNLVGEAQGTAYGLAPEIPPEERAAALMLAQGLLARYPDTPILVVEKAAAVLTRSTPQSLVFFGLAEDDEEPRRLDERLLAENPLPTLWLTGKTQYAEHVAQELGKPILIKPASELFDKYLGESEKRIAEAFDQAEEEGAILLLDEADSFLRDRQRSEQGWQVSTVNELLQRMERFEEIFICTTNLYAQLDAAALRRFTFKLEFLPLTFEQRWAMFLNETGLAGKSLGEKRKAGYEDRLALMQDLTPGDFATVKRQCLLLGEDLTPEDWIMQLELEVKAKQRPATGQDRSVQV